MKKLALLFLLAALPAFAGTTTPLTFDGSTGNVNNIPPAVSALSLSTPLKLTGGPSYPLKFTAPPGTYTTNVYNGQVNSFGGNSGGELVFQSNVNYANSVAVENDSTYGYSAYVGRNPAHYETFAIGNSGINGGGLLAGDNYWENEAGGFRGYCTLANSSNTITFTGAISGDTIFGLTPTVSNVVVGMTVAVASGTSSTATLSSAIGSNITVTAVNTSTGVITLSGNTGSSAAGTNQVVWFYFPMPRSGITLDGVWANSGTTYPFDTSQRWRVTYDVTNGGATTFWNSNPSDQTQTSTVLINDTGMSLNNGTSLFMNQTGGADNIVFQNGNGTTDVWNLQMVPSSGSELAIFSFVDNGYDWTLSNGSGTPANSTFSVAGKFVAGNTAKFANSIISTSSTPSVTGGTNVATTSATGSNLAGTLQVVLSGASSGTIATLTLANSVSYPTKAIMILTPANALTANLVIADDPYVTGTATTCVLNTGGTGIPAGSYLWNYIILGY